MSDQRRVVIIGGGFGGLTAAKRLRRTAVQITLVDQRNHHLFQPLLYQVATAALNPADIATPIRSVLSSQRNVEVLLDRATGIDRVAKKVILAGGELTYDYLVIGTGATHSYFGHPEWAENAPGLKSIEDALEIRRRVLLAYEAAEREATSDQAPWLTFVVVGGGPTGVELAGALAEISRHTLSRDFRHIDPADAKVILLEGEDRVLPVYPPSLSQKAKRQLQGLGVEVRTGRRVTAIDREGVSIGDERIEARTVLWAAGVQASPLARALDVPLDSAGRVLVREDLTVPGDDAVFVIGDLAAVTQDDGTFVPGVAPSAIQEGAHTADNIRRLIRGQPTKPFRYWNKGSLATIGRAAGVADLGRLRLSGAVAWLAWLMIHIFFLIGFRNRVLVLIQWAWSYLTYQRGARLITGAPELQLPDRGDH
ncbi:MAG: NAD(P)/FAD-dependent oxidoreductase [Acidobacteriota bacterium]